jgi:hypothetical protein
VSGGRACTAQTERCAILALGALIYGGCVRGGVVNLPGAGTPKTVRQREEGKGSEVGFKKKFPHFGQVRDDGEIGAPRNDQGLLQTSDAGTADTQTTQVTRRSLP